MSIISVLSKNPIIIKELQKILPNMHFHLVKIAATDEQFKKSDIVIGDFDLLGPHIYNLPNAKWVQGTWAGIDALLPYIKPNDLPLFPITRFSGKHFGRLMGEYITANIINFERNLFEIKENQTKQQWAIDGKISNYRSIADLNIGILGLGNIGDRIAQTLNYLGAKILGYGRKSSIDLNGHKHIMQYYNANSLPLFLKNSDYIVNVLPNTVETRGLLNGNVLENCSERGTVFVNIGRGTIISNECLIHALEKQWISGAILDVFENEPLAKESPLWKMSNVFISPHVSGMTRAKDVAEQFSNNYKLFKQNIPIPTTIDFSKGY